VSEEDEMQLFARGWWMVIARGALAMLFGIGALLWPMDGARLGAFFGVAAFGIGVLAILAGLAAPFAGRRAQRTDAGWPLLCEGILGVALGALAIAAAVAPITLALVIAGWAAVTGLLEIATALQLHRVLAGERMILVAGVASLLFSVVFVLRAPLGASSEQWMVGSYAVLFGACLFVAGMRLRHWDLGEPDEA
jgi:uncharacterized membrane protein HdeD (DUF308 family)